MKHCLTIFAAVSLLFACTPEQNNPSGTDEPGGGKDKTVHVTGITLNPTSVTIKEGESVTITAIVTPDNAENKAYTWSSSNDQVASVSGGKVTGVKAGSATITATTEDGGKTATCAVTVQQNNAPAITVGAEHISAVSVVLQGKANLGTTVASDLKIGFQYSTSAGIMPSNSTTIDADDADANYNYTTTVAGLDPDTKYYFRSFVRQNGQDTYGETKEFTTKNVASLIETRDASGVEAAKATLNAKLDLTDVEYKDLAYGFLWGTSESTLNTDIKCTEIKDKTITAPLTDLSHKTQYWYKAYVTLDKRTFYSEVKTFTTDVVPVESVSLDKTEYNFKTIGNTLTLVATVLPVYATDKSVSWTSDDEDVATVDANGRVTAKGDGKATIKAEAKDGSGKYASCSVTVNRPVSSIELNKTSLVLYLGESNVSETLTATVIPSDASNTEVTWTSSNTSVATVSSSGVVTGKSKGTATITVTANDGNGAQTTCAVEVKQYVTYISLDKNSLWLVIDDDTTISATILPDNANDKSLTWSSSDNSIASVDNSGKVTARANGNATIKATANDGSGVFASCSVIVIAEKVDMGIKTSDGKTLYWSTRNLCESGFVKSPEDYGDYYAWGETEPKEDYSWSTYKLRKSGDSLKNVKFSKYNTDSSYGAVDNKTVLEPADDVASIKLGGKWRMPTREEWSALNSQCKWTSTTQNGVNGILVTATNGNSIFLPYTGYRSGTSRKNKGLSGNYWSSSLYISYPFGVYAYNTKDYELTYYRCDGLSVRPVTE